MFKERGNIRRLSVIMSVFLFSVLLYAGPPTGAVKIGDLYYILDKSAKTAATTYDTGATSTSVNYSELTDIIVPETISYGGADYTVTSVGTYTFRGSPELISVQLPETITKIEERAFDGCNACASLNMPGALTSIGRFAFQNCLSLTGVLEIPSAVTTIGDYAFRYCAGFTELILPESLTEIGGNVFSQCNGLKGTLRLPGTITKIGSQAFYRTAYDTIILPESLTSIAYYAFGENHKLEFIVCLSPKPPTLSTHVFTVTPDESEILIQKQLRVPAGSVSAYLASSEWKIYTIYQLGDANLSKTLTVADAVAVANHITGAVQAGTFDFAGGDINGSGDITVLDAVGIVDAVAKYNPSGLTAFSRRSEQPSPASGKEISLHLDAGPDLVALQADIVCGEEAVIEDIILPQSLADTHTLTVSHPAGGGITRVIIFSASGDTMDCTEAVLTVRFNGPANENPAITDIIAVTSDASEHLLDYDKEAKRFSMKTIGNVADK